MSWHATLIASVDGIEVELVDYNYTHNCNVMASTVLEELGTAVEHHWLIGRMGGSWFKILDGLSGKDGGELLQKIISGLEKKPRRFRAMNPKNGWGNYDTFLARLKEMLDSSLKYPSAKWDVSG